MNSNQSVRRAQVYGFLVDAFLYPTYDWREDLPALERIVPDLGLAWTSPPLAGLDVAELQAEHRRAFGLTGSLCYETEYGLPHEFRQSQELADIAGFYRAFGLNLGGPVRERPDHLAVELEFMQVLLLKEALAAEAGRTEQMEICVEAQRKFLEDHLGRWIDWFAEAFSRSAGDGVYRPLVHLTGAFVAAEAERLGARPERRRLSEVRATPAGPDLSCGACPAVSAVT